jgi:UDP-2-acetamido-2-deoxy-ribo-hexuluronate aminotransferase
MQFIDLKAQYQTIQSDLQARMNRVFEHGQFILGPEVQELEEQLAAFVGAKHCLTVSNGTEALLIALMALGIGPGDEVITTPFSFIAPVEMIILLGAKPVFVDINPLTYNIDATLIEKAITPKTKAILPINLYGQCADFDQIQAIATRHKLAIIEDGAQSFGASYKGRNSGLLGTISCTSFFPAKPLGCYGEGGACFTQDDELATIIRQIRHHGQDKRYHHIRLGLNGRLPTLQAAILLSKMTVFQEELERRQWVAENYNKQLQNIVSVPHIESYNKSSFAQYTVRLSQRDQVIAGLSAKNIPTAVHYPVAIHQQPVMIDLGYSATGMPHAEQAALEVLSLPFHPYMSLQDIEKVTHALDVTLNSLSNKVSEVA